MLFTIIGESVSFITIFFISCLLLLLEILQGQNFGLLPNAALIFITVVSSFSSQFSFVLFNNRELFVSTTNHLVNLESQLSNGKQIYYTGSGCYFIITL
jgi:hypothetical protein